MEETITITVRLFSSVKDAIGKSEVRLTLPKGSFAKEALEHIRSKNRHALERLPIRLALNHEYITEDSALHNNDELALIPPVSGG